MTKIISFDDQLFHKRCDIIYIKFGPRIIKLFNSKVCDFVHCFCASRRLSNFYRSKNLENQQKINSFDTESMVPTVVAQKDDFLRILVVTILMHVNGGSTKPQLFQFMQYIDQNGFFPEFLNSSIHKSAILCIIFVPHVDFQIVIVRKIQKISRE